LQMSNQRELSKDLYSFVQTFKHTAEQC
jgi:hypothetical protein